MPRRILTIRLVNRSDHKSYAGPSSIWRFRSYTSKIPQMFDNHLFRQQTRPKIKRRGQVRVLRTQSLLKNFHGPGIHTHLFFVFSLPGERRANTAREMQCKSVSNMYSDDRGYKRRISYHQLQVGQWIRYPEKAAECSKLAGMSSIWHWLNFREMYHRSRWSKTL